MENLEFFLTYKSATFTGKFENFISPTTFKEWFENSLDSHTIFSLSIFFYISSIIGFMVWRSRAAW